MRLEFTLERSVEDFTACFESEVAAPHTATWRLASAGARPRIAILCSTEDHCLLDLLLRIRSGELPAEVHAVIATAAEHRQPVEALGAPFMHLPTETDAMAGHERQLLAALDDQVELVVLARYMRILSGDFLKRLSVPAINIHHSFLPAFAGSAPYARAHERGVKLIGATAHYVTEELDAGPIIEQETIRVSHRDGIDDLRRKGRDVERVVLARAVLAHLEDRVARWGGRTVVF